MEAVFTKLSFVVSIGLQVFILALLIRRRLEKRFFWFLLYLAYELCESVVRVVVSGNQGLYLKVYWYTEVGDVTLSFLAVRESFLNVFRPYTRFRWFTGIIWGGVGIALLWAVFKAWVLPPVESNREIFAIIGLEVAVHYVLTAIGILYFAFVVWQKVKGHRWESTVILGFTVNVMIAVFGYLTRSVFGRRFSRLSEWLTAVAYIVGALIWALGLWQPEPKDSGPGRDLKTGDLEALEGYIKILGRSPKRKP